MAEPADIADVIAKSNEALAQTLAAAFQSLKVQRHPSIKLKKFNGPPRRGGDPSLSEWSHDLETYNKQLGLEGAEAADVALEYLGGEAREEILCCPPVDRTSVEKILTVLGRRFGTDSVQSLHANFYGRMQNEGESVADYSRCLMTLYGQIEASAESSAESAALFRLRERALREQMIKGVRDVSVRREVRRLALEHGHDSFYELREAVLALIVDTEDTEDAELCHVRDRRKKQELLTPDSPQASDSKILGDIMNGQRQLHSAMEKLIQQQTQTTQQLQSVASSLSEMAKKKTLTCEYCHKIGHKAEKCYKRRRDLEAKQANQGNRGPQAGNAPPPS